MPAAPSFAILAGPQASTSLFSSMSPLNAFPAARSFANDAGSSDASLSSFQNALDTAQRSAASPPPSDTPPDDSPDQAAGEAADDAAATDSPTKNPPSDASKTRRQNTDSANSSTQSSQDQGDSSSPSTAASDAPAPASPNAAPTGPASRHHKSAPDSPPTSPNPAPATAASVAAAVSTQIAAAQSPPAPPPAKDQTAASATSAAPAGNANAAQAIMKKLPGPQTPASPAADNTTAGKPTTPPSQPQAAASNPEQTAATPIDQQNPPADDALSSPFQPVGKPTPKIGAQKDETAPQSQSAQTPTPAQDAAAASTLAAASPAATPLQTNDLSYHDTPKPPTTSASAIATPLAHAPATAAQNGPSADAAAAAQQPPAQDQDQTFDQIVLGLRGKLDAQNGKAEISLNPPNLGTLRVSLSLEKGALTAQFQSSSDLVRDLLKSNMEKLKGVLEGQGIAVDHLAVAAPADKVVPAAGRMPPQNAPQNDGRSAGQYTRDQNSGQKRPQNMAFTPASRAATNGAIAQAPFDVVA